ncbi:MAG: hypothetical protein AABX23_02590 [Nanoarchaeota archaeon]
MSKLLKIGLGILVIALVALITLLSINYSTQEDESSERSGTINTMLETFDNPNIQQGYIVFSFTEDSTKEQAEVILDKYRLEIEERQLCTDNVGPETQPAPAGACRTVSDWVEFVKIATVKVPVGEEKEYAKRVLENEIRVVSAEPKYQDVLG